MILLNRHFESIIDQERALGILSALLGKRSVPHAMLFTGPEGVGKKEAALAFARAMNCRGAPSEKGEPCPCVSCKKIRSSNHPDVLLIEPSGSFIKVGQVRDLLGVLSMKPYEAKARVVILSRAEAMNAESGNALLKILEEPPERTFLILTTEQKSDLLPTIVSRCQGLRFNPISFGGLKSALLRTGLKEEDAEIVAGLSGGSLKKALSMGESGEYKSKWDLRNWIIEVMESLETLSLGALLAFSERLSKDREFLEECLNIMLGWFRDLLVAGHDPEFLINRDLKERVQRASQGKPLGALISNIKAVEQVQQQIKRNANMRLATDVLIIKIANTK